MNTNSNTISLNSFFQDPRLDDLEFFNKPSSISFLDNPHDMLLDPFLTSNWQPVAINPIPIHDLDFSDLFVPIDPILILNIDTEFSERPVIVQTSKSKPKKIKKLRKPKKVVQKDRYYDKNVCRNILRRAIRCIDSDMYIAEVSNFCTLSGCSVKRFKQELVGNMELLIGPSALRGFLHATEISVALKGYILWFLRERYIREALSEGQMKDIKRYIDYKNKILVYLLE